MVSTLKVNTLQRQSGTTITIGESGDTITIAAGAAMGGSGASLTSLNATQLSSGTVPDARFPATLPAASATNLTSIPGANITGTLAAVSGVNLTALDAANIGSNKVPTARLGTGTASSSTYLAGDQTYKALSEYDDNMLQSNIAMLGFKVAVNGSLVKYDLVDQTIDEYFDSSGIDAGSSTNEDITSGYVRGITSTASDIGYWGSGADGSVTTSGDVTHTVLNKSGSYDGDMLVKNYSALTVSVGDTMTVDQPCRGMLIFVDGDCTIAGTLHMNSKGALANPTASGGSDSNAVSTNGLQLGFRTSGGSSSFTVADTNFNGCGTASRTAIANYTSLSSNGTVITVPRQGAAGANGPSGTAGAVDGTNGTAGSSGSTGGGGSGAGAHSATGGIPTNGRIGDGSYGSCFVGGSGGGNAGGSDGRSDAHMDETHATAWGGAGGIGTGATGHGNFAVNGGAGNPTGDGWCAGGSCSNSDYHSTGLDGFGGAGLIWLIVKGDLTVTGTISANGASPNGETTAGNGGAGGGSGGGAIVYAYGGTLSSSGTIQASGGLGITSGTGSGYVGGDGGAGSTQALVAQATESVTTEGGDFTLISNATTAQATATSGNLICLLENATGTATLNTDIKGYISADNGSNWEQGTLVDEGSWGTNRKILAFHDEAFGSTGTNMKYKVTTHNQEAGVKITRLYATSMGWK